MPHTFRVCFNLPATKLINPLIVAGHTNVYETQRLTTSMCRFLMANLSTSTQTSVVNVLLKISVVCTKSIFVLFSTLIQRLNGKQTVE